MSKREPIKSVLDQELTVDEMKRHIKRLESNVESLRDQFDEQREHVRKLLNFIDWQQRQLIEMTFEIRQNEEQ